MQGCAVSPDSSTLVTASFDSTLKLWNIDSRKCITTLHGHNDDVNDCAVGPDGSFIVSVSDDKTVKIWKTDLQWPCVPICSDKEKNEIRGDLHYGEVIRVPAAFRQFYSIPEFIILGEIHEVNVDDISGF